MKVRTKRNAFFFFLKSDFCSYMDGIPFPEINPILVNVVVIGPHVWEQPFFFVNMCGKSLRKSDGANN